MAQPEIIVLEEFKILKANKNNDTIVTPGNRIDLKDQSISTAELESESESTAPVQENWGWSGESPVIKKVHYFLTKETFAMAVKIFQFGAFIKCVPFELEFKNGESLRVCPFQKKWQWALWHFVNWIIFVLVAFEYTSFFFLWQRTDFGQEMAFHILYLAFTPWLLVYFLALYRNPRACVVMLNHHDEIMRNSSRLGFSRKHWASHPFVILAVYYMAWVLIVFDLMMLVFYLRHPERSQYIYSAFPSSWKKDELEWILYGGCAVYEFFWLSCGCSLISLCFCYWCACIYTFNGSLNELRTRQKLDEKMMESYLFLQVACVTFNDFTAGFFSPGFCFLVVASPVLFIYLSLTTFDILSIVVYLAFPALASVTVGLIVLFLPQESKVKIKSTTVLEHFTHLPIGARLQSQSQSHFSNLVNLSYLTNAERRGYLKRRVKAFRRLRIQVSFFGSMSLTTSQEMMDQIFNNVILLLSL